MHNLLESNVWYESEGMFIKWHIETIQYDIVDVIFFLKDVKKVYKTRASLRDIQKTCIHYKKVKNSKVLDVLYVK